jgi:xylulokinase
MSVFLGLDISTTATKALLVDESGRVVGSAASPHRLLTPRPLYSEQDPEEWWAATSHAVKAVLRDTGTPPGAVAAIGLAGQMHGLVLLDAAGRVLRPAILWNDQRASAECEEIRTRMGGLQALVAATGNDAFPGFSAPKLLWVRRHEPGIYGRVRQVLLPKDYVRFRMTGAYATDRAGAGGTLFLDLATRDWSDRVLQALDVPRELLSQTHEGTEITGRLEAGAAAVLGLPAGIPVVGGGGDQAAQAVGVGAVTPDVSALTVGTSGVVFAASERPVFDPDGRAHAFPHAAPGLWHMMGVMLSAAGSLQWYRDTLAPDASFDDLVGEAAGVPAGSDDLLFLPYLSGERTPHADPRARGVFFGLTLGHGRGHLTRAVLEGVAFGLKDNLDLLIRAGVPAPSALRASGGALKSATWRGILASVLDTDLEIVASPEGAAQGAALLAGVGAGAWGDVRDACRAAVRIDRVEHPDPETAGRYREVHARFRALYPAVKEHFPTG